MNKRDTNKSVGSLLDTLKELIPDITSFNYTINLSIYDVTCSTTYVISNVIPKTTSNFYIDNTYTIIYDPLCQLSVEDYTDTYYITSYEDLVCIVEFIKNNQELYTYTTWCYDTTVNNIDNMIDSIITNTDDELIHKK